MGNRLPPSPQVNVRLPTNKMLLAGSMVDWKKYADKAEAALDVWNVMMRNAPEPNMAGEIERLKANRNLFAGKYRSIIVLMDDTRQKLQEVVDHIQDEGDRAFFGSTNHADWLRDLVSDMVVRRHGSNGRHEQDGARPIRRLPAAANGFKTRYRAHGCFHQTAES